MFSCSYPLGTRSFQLDTPVFHNHYHPDRSPEPKSYMANFEILWQTQLVEHPLYRDSWSFQHRNIIERSGMAFDPMRNTAYIGLSEGTIIAIDVSTSEIVWKYSGQDSITSNVVYDHDLLYAGTMQGELLALHRSNGSVVWKYQAGLAIGKKIAVSHSAIFFTTHDDNIISLEKHTGSWNWDYHHYFEKDITLLGTPSPYVRDNFVYAGFADGSLFCFDAQTGSKVWAIRVKSDSLKIKEANYFVDIDTQPVSIDDSLYFASYSEGLYQIDPADGKILSRNASLTSIFEIRKSSYLSHILYLLTGSGKVLVYHTQKQKVITAIELQRNLITGFLETKDRFIITDADQAIYSVDHSSGNVLEYLFNDRGFIAPVFVNDHEILSLSHHGTLYRLAIY